MDKYQILAFRGVENPDLAYKAYEGHSKVLTEIGIQNLNTTLPDWLSNHNTYVAIVIDDAMEVVAGLRVQRYVEGESIPLITALEDIDSKIVSIFNSHMNDGTAEICGLWAAKKVFSKGFANLLCITSVAIVKLMGLNNFYCFAAPYTEKMIKANGCINVIELGDSGRFPYPTEEFISIVLHNPDIDKMEFADVHNISRIRSLIKDPQQSFVEKAPRGEIEVSYNLMVP